MFSNFHRISPINCFNCFFFGTFASYFFLAAICFPGALACLASTWKEKNKKEQQRRQRQIQVWNCQGCHGVVHWPTVAQKKTEWKNNREKRIKEEESALAASPCLCCHARVKQAQLRNCYPNRGHREGREGWKRVYWGKKIVHVFPSKSVLLRRLALPMKWRNDSGSCTQFSSCWQRWGFCLGHSERHRVAMRRYCFFNRDGVKMGHTQGATGNQILFVCRYNTCVPFIASSVIKQMLLL